MTLNGVIKQMAVDAVRQGQPTNVMFGKVTSVSPLVIETDQNLRLSQGFLVLTRNVTDYEVEMTVEHVTEEHTHTHKIEDTYTGDGKASEETHNHNYVGKKVFTVHKALKVGEKVILISCSGGQRYFVIDRVEE